MPVHVRNDHYLRADFHKRNSRASDTSSAYSGSDMMQSSIDEPDVTTTDHDYSALVESLVDSDDEESYAESNDVSMTSLCVE